MSELTSCTAIALAKGEYHSNAISNQHAFVTTSSGDVYVGGYHPSICRADGIDPSDAIEMGRLRGGSPSDPRIIVGGKSYDYNMGGFYATTVTTIRRLVASHTPPIPVIISEH